jgi:Ca2+-transporting ATPase
MTLTRLWQPDWEYSVSGVGHALEGGLSLLAGAAAEDEVGELLACMATASNAVESRDAAGAPHFGGDPTEVAVLIAARKLGLGPAGRRLRELPFDSFRRRMSTVDEIQGRDVVHMKGAPDAVLACCSLGPDGRPLTAELGNRVLEQAAAYAAQGMRRPGGGSTLSRPRRDARPGPPRSKGGG